MRLSWLQRYERRLRKQKRRAVAHHVRAYRKRQKQAGLRRIDVTMPVQEHALLLKLKRPGETMSTVILRILRQFTGNAESQK